MNYLPVTSTASTALYEAQLAIPGQRMCGAAAVVMALRRLGIQTDQKHVWQQIAQQHDQHFRASTYHLARFVHQVGLSASVIQSHQPWKVLQTCWQNNLSVIINHRLGPHHNEGHYSVLARINRNTIHLHDQSLGPSVAYSKEEFLALWLPTSSQSEIAGNVLVAITNSDYEPSIWAHCNQCIPKSMACRNCGNELPLQPVRALGCVQPTCVQRLWYRLFCPQCDAAHECISG